jgi:hypothetical protein
MNLQKIPNEIIINNIIPYTYQTQPRNLLNDIVSFKLDFNIVKNLYFFDYNIKLLLYDLYTFFNCKKILSRSFMIKQNRIKPKHFLFSQTDFLYSQNERLIQNKVKCFWGLLTSVERTRFINNVIE